MKYIQDDICETVLTDIIHGCNAQGVMGSGVAKAIRDRFVFCYEDYKDALNSTFGTNRRGAETLGFDAVHQVRGLSGHVRRVHNLVTQVDFGRDGRVYADYDAIRNGITNIVKNYPDVKRFAIPKIGCGLGGLDWTIVESIVSEIETKLDVEFWVYVQ